MNAPKFSEHSGPANDGFRTFLEDCNFDPKDTLN